VLVGINTGDDAAIYRLSADLALVQTVDLFTPVVDDPYEFGQVAAANSLSDVYAMGARPIMALAIIGFPATRLPLAHMAAILRGGADKAKEAGVEIVGGHSIDDPEPKYGLCVAGLVHPKRIYRNVGARLGDLLVLTKPLGSGVLTTAIKRQLLAPQEVQEVVNTMAALNRGAAEAMMEVGASAATDITGFGLLGHLTEMLGTSSLAARIELSAIPVMSRVRNLIREGVYPGGTERNLSFYSAQVRWHPKIEDCGRLLVADAQTSGGLLIAVERARAEALLSSLERRGVTTRAVIGEIIAKDKAGIEVVP